MECHFNPDSKAMVMEHVSTVLQVSDVALALTQRFRLRIGEVQHRVSRGGGGGCIEGVGGQGVEADNADRIHWAWSSGGGSQASGAGVLGVDGLFEEVGLMMAMTDNALNRGKLGCIT